MKNKTLAIGITCTFLLVGCATLFWKEVAKDKVVLELKWDLESYAEFVKQNMNEKNKKYSSDYSLYDFVVDTEYGSTLIQNLIDPEAVATIATDLGLNDDREYRNNLSNLYQYVIEEYNYILSPYEWQTVTETVKAKKGDCKSLSLLLMSILVSSRPPW